MTRRIRSAAAFAMAFAPFAASAAEAESGGMPQLDFGNPLVIAQVVWMLLIFAALYWLVKERGLPLVAEVLDERRRRIDGDLEVAQAAKAQADIALAAHRQATQAAKAEAQGSIADALHAAQLDAEAKARTLNEKLTVQIAAAEANIEAARSAAMGALRDVVVDTTESLVTKLVGAADRAMVGRAVDGVLATRGRA